MKKMMVMLLLELSIHLGMAAKLEEIGGHVGDNGFCEEFAHLSLCQLRKHLTQLGKLLDLAIGEIDFLAGAEMVESAHISAEEQAQTEEKRGGARSLAGAPLLVRLASRATNGGSMTSENVGKIRTTATGASILLGGPLGQSAPGIQARPSTYRLVRVPSGKTAGGRTASALETTNGQRQANQLLRQLWA